MPAGAPPGAIVFDMDGTLVHTREAAWEVFSEINAQHHLGIDTREAFFAIFETDLREGLERACSGPAQATAVYESFLAALRRSYTPPFVPGMAHVVHTLAAQTTLFLITGNAMSVVRRILEDNGVATCFAHVFTGDVEPSKAVSMRQILDDPAYLRPRRCSPDYVETGVPAGVAPGDVVVVTDTVGDVREARSLGLRALGVSWGMHGQTELLAAGADAVALWPEEVLAELAVPGGATCADGNCAVHTEPAPAVDVWSRARAAAAVRRRPAGGSNGRPAGVRSEVAEAVRAIIAGANGNGKLSGADKRGPWISAPGVLYPNGPGPQDRDHRRLAGAKERQ